MDPMNRKRRRQQANPEQRQVTAPVRFVDMVHTLGREGVTRLLEIGPGRVLTGLARRIDRKLSCQNLSLAAEVAEASAFAAGA